MCGARKGSGLCILIKYDVAVVAAFVSLCCTRLAFDCNGSLADHPQACLSDVS